MPRRILCLSAEAADICARIGAWDRVVAVSAFASQEGLSARPVIGGFSTCDVDRALRFEPDLVITFSDVQAEVSARFIRAGCTVLATNQRTLAEIAGTIRLIGRILGRLEEGEVLARNFMEEIEALTIQPERRPRVYFEEWPDPPISGIGWVGELIDRVGGTDIFAGRRGKAAEDRLVTLAEIVAADPEIIVASWCGKPVDLAKIHSRPGFPELAAVRGRRVYEIPSDSILQPGPRILHGARRLAEIMKRWRKETWMAAIP